MLSLPPGNPEDGPHVAPLGHAINRALQALVLFDPEAWLLRLRSLPGLQARFEAYAHHEPSFRYLARVTKGSDPRATDMEFSSWMDMGGLHRSLIPSKPSPSAVVLWLRRPLFLPYPLWQLLHP